MSDREITPQMIEAGADVLMDSGISDGLVSRRYALIIAKRMLSSALGETRTVPAAIAATHDSPEFACGLV